MPCQQVFILSFINWTFSKEEDIDSSQWMGTNLRGNSKSQYQLSLCYIPNNILTYLMLIKALWGSYSSYPHVTHKETEAQRADNLPHISQLLSVGAQVQTSHSLAGILGSSPEGEWRRQWYPTPVFLPGESHGRRSLVGRRLWGLTESDTTEAT